MSEPNNLLFRNEVIQRQGTRWLGSIQLLQPISSTLIAIVSALISASLVLFIFFGSYGKKAKVSGVTVPIAGSVSVTSSTGGIIRNMRVREGLFVEKGSPLLDIVTPRDGENGDVGQLIEQQIRIRQSTLQSERRARLAQDSERRRSAEAKLSNLNLEFNQLNEEILLVKARKTFAEESVKKLQTLQESGFVSSSQTQQKQEDLIDIVSRLGALIRSRTQLENTRISLMSEWNNLSIALDADLSQIDRAIAGTDQELAENSTRRASRILAPESGMVTAISYQEGQTIGVGQTILNIVASDRATNLNPKVEVHLFAPSKTIGFVTPGQIVRIRFQSFPYQKFGLYEGAITNVSKTPFAPSELPANLASTILSNSQQTILGFNSNEALFRIKVQLNSQSVSLYGRSQPLKAGMTLEADIMQDRRKIWEWIAEPLIASTK